MSKIFIYILIFLGMATPVMGATIHGVAYEWCTLEPIKGVVIEVNSTPKQVVVASNGTYSFNLPTGSYVLKAKYFKNGILEYYCEENITITREGDYTLDLLMLPAPFEEILFGESIDINVEEFEEKRSIGYLYLIFLALAVVIMFAYLYLHFYKKRKERLPEDLPDDLREIMEILTREGGRMTQTELRKRLPYSEAKISLMLSDLEDRGLIKKIKKGKGNIIIKL